MALAKLTPETLRTHKGVSFVGISTVFLCHDGKGKIFLAKRSKNARDEHGRWDPGAGGLKHGFTLAENVTRELMEEYNSSPLDITFMGHREVFRELDDGTPTHWLAFDYVVLVDPGQTNINEPDMFDDSGWFARDNLPSPLHSQLEVFLAKYSDELDKIIWDNR